MDDMTISTPSDKKILIAALLCFCLGFIGMHRFYVGKNGTAILQLLTGGGLGIRMLIDFIILIMGNFHDKQDNRLCYWM